MLIAALSFAAYHMYAQRPTDSSIQVQIKTYYNLALQYKDGLGKKIDYSKAFYYFDLAANLNDPQSIYSLGYLYYKGLGCIQNYNRAVSLFSQGAFIGKDNSMYFYGLCFRNGYGVAKNEDSAKYWLNRSAALGYNQAIEELKMPVGENSNDSAKALVQIIKSAAVSHQTSFSQYIKIDQNNNTSLTEDIGGIYNGYIIQYDWSGENVISCKNLELDLRNERERVSGQWIESISDTVMIEGTLRGDSLVFARSEYKRKDHYSPNTGVRYIFQNASFNLEKFRDSLYLAGDIMMFSPDRKEPSKPLFIVLSKPLLQITKLFVTPNPFHDQLNVSFSLAESNDISMQLISMSGEIIYTKILGYLEAGSYQYSLNLGIIAPELYILKLIFNNQNLTFKVIKE